MAAADTEITEEEAPKKSKMPLILGVVLALVGGGGAFFAASSGMFHGAPASDKKEMPKDAEKKMLPSFVELEPIIVSLSPNAKHQYLQFRAQIEAKPEYAAEVEALKPRIVDVLNGYLRAIDPAELERPSALSQFRAQMLRRIQVVAGPNRVTDLLIMEFVLN